MTMKSESFPDEAMYVVCGGYEVDLCSHFSVGKTIFLHEIYKEYLSMHFNFSNRLKCHVAAKDYRTFVARVRSGAWLTTF